MFINVFAKGPLDVDLTTCIISIPFQPHVTPVKIDACVLGCKFGYSTRFTRLDTELNDACKMPQLDRATESSCDYSSWPHRTG